MNMKHLDKIVDQILKIEPTLETQLLPIKTKWEKSNRTAYWKQLFQILNSKIPAQHPRRSEIQKIFIPKHTKIKKKIHTFESPSAIETVIGVLPEPMDCKIRKYDRMQIDLSKTILEARMTHNNELMINSMQKFEKLELKQKEAWVEIKDHFNLWSVNEPTSFFIRERDHLLVLTAVKSQGGGSGGGEGPDGSGYMLRLDPEMLKKLMKYFNLNPPPSGFFPPGFIPPSGD